MLSVTSRKQIDAHHRLRAGMFVAQVIGRSMEPLIPDGSHCLFASPVAGSRQGRAVLVVLRDDTDPETGERFTVKTFESQKAESTDESWRHIRITLRPKNPDFVPIILTADNDRDVGVVAEFLQVLNGE